MGCRLMDIGVSPSISCTPQISLASEHGSQTLAGSRAGDTASSVKVLGRDLSTLLQKYLTSGTDLEAWDSEIGYFQPSATSLLSLVSIMVLAD